jgi:flagellin
MAVVLDLGVLNTIAQNGLSTRQTQFSDTVGRLSSGLRMSGPRDDVAAWMTGVRMENRLRGWNEATQNVQNGMSLLETADGGAASIHETLLRLRELAVEASNGTHGVAEHQAMNDEMIALRQHIYDTVNSTEFNGEFVLKGTGTIPPSTIDLSLVLPTTASNPGYTAQSQSGTYAVDISVLAMRGAFPGNQPASQLAAGDPPTVFTITTDLGTTTATITDLDPPASWPAIINAAAAAVGATAEITTAATTFDDGTLADPFGDGFLLFRTTGTGAASTLRVSTNKFSDSTGFTATPAFGQGVDMQGTLNGVAFVANGLSIQAGPGAGAAAGLSFDFTSIPPIGPAGSITVFVPPTTVTDFEHVVQMAPDYQDEHLLSIASLTINAFDDTGTVTTSLGSLDLTTQAGAQAAIDIIDAAVQQLSDARASIGADLQVLQGELSLTLLGSSATETAGARITDADIAAESTTMLQAQIGQQTSYSVLQALSQQSSSSLDFVLQMLRSSPLQAGA